MIEILNSFGSIQKVMTSMLSTHTDRRRKSKLQLGLVHELNPVCQRLLLLLLLRLLLLLLLLLRSQRRLVKPTQTELRNEWCLITVHVVPHVLHHSNFDTCLSCRREAVYD